MVFKTITEKEKEWITIELLKKYNRASLKGRHLNCSYKRLIGLLLEKRSEIQNIQSKEYKSISRLILKIKSEFFSSFEL